MPTLLTRSATRPTGNTPDVLGTLEATGPRSRWNRFTTPQLVVMALATIAPSIILGAIGAALLGVISLESMMDVALAAGEDPGLLTFGAMFLASPVQWATGRSQIRVRKYLGIVFYLLALSNAGMFIIERGVGATLSEPFLVAGLIAVMVGLPLFLTSSRWSQRAIGMKRWRQLHKLTYVVAVALVGHLLLLGEPEAGVVLIMVGFIARIPGVRRFLTDRGTRRKAPAE